MKTVTMSVRVSQEDAEFIAGLEVAGASTPSDKLRAIIAEARQRHGGVRDHAAAVRRVEELLGPGRDEVRDLEHRYRVHSELVGLVADWLPEAAAGLITGPSAEAGRSAGASSGGRAGEGAVEGESRQRLTDLERRLADKVFALVEAALRLGVTRQCRCYDGNVVAERLGPVLEIARLIEAAQKSKEA